jgi:hypothetical protein
MRTCTRPGYACCAMRKAASSADSPVPCTANCTAARTSSGNVASTRSSPFWAEDQGGAVTLIQRFGFAANLNIHPLCLVLDGVYRYDADGVPAFLEAQAPTDAELQARLQMGITRLMEMLTRRGVLVEDTG